MGLIKSNLLILLLVGFFNPTVAVAQSANNNLPVYQNVEGTLATYVCTPQNDGQDLPRCINRLYRFGIVAGALAMVFFMVWAGYYYIVGGEQSKQKGKAMFLNTLVGMGLLLGSYALLRFINPDLVAFKPIQPPIFTAENLPPCEDIGLGVKCISDDGSVSTGVATGGASGPRAQNCPSGQVVSVGSAFPQRGSWQICKDLLDKLSVAWNNIKQSNYDWKNNLGIGQTFQNPTPSRSPCHRPDTPQTGTCADIGFGSSISGYPPYPPKGVDRTPLTGNFARQYNELCRELNKVGGVIIQNEAATATECGTFANIKYNTSWHLHIILSAGN